MEEELSGRFFNGVTWQEMFPYPTLRQFQDELCDELSISIREKPVTIIDSPNGSGKTATSLSVALSTPSDGVFFLTRTHRQIEHIIEEIEMIKKKRNDKIPYIEWAARKYLCINPDVLAKEEKLVDISCHKAAHKDEFSAYCAYYPYKADNSIQIPLNKNGNEPSVGDIKTLKSYGEHFGICPYYLARLLGKEYPIVLNAGYSYIFDPFMRELLDISMHNKVIVCDECHNLANAMEDAMKRELSEYIISKLIKDRIFPTETKEFLKNVKNFIGEVKDEYERSAGEEGLDYDTIGDIMYGNDITSVTIERVRKETSFLKNDPSMFQYLITLNDILSFFEIYFKISEESFIGYCNTDTKRKNDIIVGIQSLDIRPIIDDLIAEKCKIVLMTGTISLSVFMFQLGLTDENTNILQYKSPKRNIEVFVTPIGIKNHKLSSYFQARKDVEMLADFGHSIKSILPYVPGGSLIFFPSYAFKDAMINEWDNQNIITYDYADDCYYFEFSNGKIRIFDDNQENSIEIINNFRKEAKKKRAVLTACFRSRASEGEDFVQRLSRAIFIIGVPLPSINDKSIQHKIKYYNARQSGMGNIWFNSIAMHAVNQAIGRGIRDAEKDYCAVYLMDTRYQTEKYYKMLSGWIKDNKIMHERISTVRNTLFQLKEFYKKCKSMFGI